MNGPMMHESFLVHRGFRYFWLAFGVGLLAIIAYIWHQPQGAPNGGTWLGYTLGGASALLVVWLSWFGIRKRQYSLGAGRLKAWLSAHVYMGLVLIVLATLHTGFQIGWNIHSIAYGLLIITVASGIFGIYAYSAYPRLMSANRAGETLDSLMLQIVELDQELRSAGRYLSEDISAALIRSEQETRIGGTLIHKLTAAVPDCPTAAARNLIETHHASQGALDPNIGKAIALLNRKETLLRRARRDVQIQAVLRIWLFLHVPMAVALLAAIIAHVVAVFYFW
jgi:hypothetical protein